MKMKLREISTPELLIVYLNSLETPEWLEKGQNRSRMMCGLDCSIMWCWWNTWAILCWSHTGQEYQD